MTNDFANLSAESETDRLATVSALETAELDHGPDGDPYHDADAYRITPEEKNEAWRHWAAGMTLLRSILAEIEPQLERVRAAEDYATNGFFPE